MNFLKENKKPNNGEAIHYEIEEFIYGRTDYVTDCPHGVKGRYTNAINKVGDLGCNTCEWQVRNNPSAQVVRCAFPKVSEEPVRKLFKD